MSKIRRTGGVEDVATVPQVLRGGGIGKLLAGKQEGHVSTFVAKRHRFGERALSSDPAEVHPERFVAPGSRDVEILVPQSFHHLEKLLFRALVRHSRDESNDSGHIYP